MLRESAYAKINLFLDVFARRPDGYHELRTVMQTVDLADTLSLEILPSHDRRIFLTCSDPSLPTDAGNLAFRAAELYLNETGITESEFRFSIEKQIPMSAGLAGGSADAAAVLRLLNQNFGNRLSTTELCALGRKLGADVPFCVRGGTCLCEGVGEILFPLPAKPDYWVVITKAPKGVSTPEAFARLDTLHGDFSRKIPEEYAALCTDLSSLPNVATHTYNSFEDVILPLRPEVGTLKKILLTEGAAVSRMSGSGPSVYGLFANAEDAERAARHLQSTGVFAAVCRPTGPIL